MVQNSLVPSLNQHGKESISEGEPERGEREGRRGRGRLATMMAIRRLFRAADDHGTQERVNQIEEKKKREREGWRGREGEGESTVATRGLERSSESPPSV